MGVKQVKTSDGIKLVDTKTSKLAGSAPKKAKAPASNQVDKKLTKATAENQVTLTNVPAIDSAYRNFKTRLPVATRHGIGVDKLEAAQRKTSLIHELIFAINDDPNGMGLPHSSWVAIMTRAYNRYLRENGPIVDASPTVLESIQTYVKELIGASENYILPEQGESEVIVGYLNELKGFGVSTDEVNPEVSKETLEEALNMLEEAVNNYKTSPFPPGSRDFDPNNADGLASDAFVSIGYGEKDANNKVAQLFSKLSWEPF